MKYETLAELSAAAKAGEFTGHVFIYQDDVVAYKESQEQADENIRNYEPYGTEVFSAQKHGDLVLIDALELLGIKATFD